MLLPGAVLAATVGVLAYAARDALGSRTAVWVSPAVPAVGVASADEGGDGIAPERDGTGPGAVVVQAPGWVEPAPYPVSVAALVEGVVREVLVLEGEVVKADQVVARMIDDDAKLAVRSARAALAERRADVSRAGAALGVAEAQVRVEQAAAEELRDEVARKRELVERGAVGTGEYRRLEIRLGGLDAKVGAAERIAEEARASLRQAEASVTSAEVAVEEAELRLGRTEIRSPADGVVMARLVEPGSRVSMGATGGENGMAGTVLRLYDPGRLQVRVDVPLADAGKVGVGTACSITCEAAPETTFHGRVTRVVHEANIQRNTVQFKVGIDDPAPVLKPEMLARVKLHAGGDGARTGAGGGAAGSGAGGDASLLIPASAVAAPSGAGSGSGSVWVVDVASGSPVARRREVGVGAAADEGYVLVRSGLRLTDRVILDPPASLHEGCSLRVLGERGAGAAGARP